MYRREIHVLRPIISQEIHVSSSNVSSHLQEGSLRFISVRNLSDRKFLSERSVVSLTFIFFKSCMIILYFSIKNPLRFIEKLKEQITMQLCESMYNRLLTLVEGSGNVRWILTLQRRTYNVLHLLKRISSCDKRCRDVALNVCITTFR